MSAIKGTNIIAPVVPFDTNDIYASHMAKYGHGGWRTAEDLNERDAIKELRREDLMVCAVREDSYNNSTRGNAFYILDVNHDASTSTSLLDNNNWIPLEFGGDCKDWILPPPPRSFYPGNQGERSYDEDFIYICILDNVWKRVAFDFFEDGFEGTSGNGTAGYLADGVVPIWCGDQWCFNLVVSDVESTSGAGTDGEIDLLITFTDGSQKLIPLGVEEHWTLPPPPSTFSPGKMGDRSYDDNFFYICIQDNIWKRVSYDFFLFTGSTSGTSGGSLSLPNGVVPIWNNINNSFDYELVVSDIETTSGTAGNVLVTYTDKTQKLLEIFSGMGGSSTSGEWTLPPPLSSSSIGFEGERSYDDEFFYVCVQDNLWKRINLDLFLFSGSTSGTSGIGLSLPNGVVPVWDESSNFFGYDLVVQNTEITNVSGTSFINITYTDSSSTSFPIIGSGSSTLNELTDVTLTPPSDNQFLRYTGSNWVNETVIINDHTTAGYVQQSYFDSTTTGINNNLNSLDIRVDALEADSTHSPDYTTAGLASSSWVINNFVDNDTFSSSTQGIYEQLDLLSNIDSLKKPDVYSPNGSYPTTYYGSAIEAGDTWRITSNGTMGTVIINQEDLLISLADLPAQTDSNFMTVESNRDQATESFMGVSKIATNVDVTTGTNDTNFVTPLKLQNKVDLIPNYTTAGLSTITYVNDSISNSLVGGTNGLTKIGNNIELGGTLSSDVLIDGVAGSFVMNLGAFAPDKQLSSFSVGTNNNVSLYNFESNSLSSALDLLNNYAGLSSNDANGITALRGNTILGTRGDNRKFSIFLYGGIDTGSGESFTINGVTFTEGIDFIGQSDPFLDAESIANLDFSGVTDFVSVQYTPGTESVVFNFDTPATTSTTIINGFIQPSQFNTQWTLTENGLFLTVGDTGFVIGGSDGNNTFTDATSNLAGIQYEADYSENYTDRSLVDKAYVDSISVGGTNGLTKIGNNIELGGTLSSNVSINGGGANEISFGNNILNENLTYFRLNAIESRELYNAGPYPFTNGLKVDKNPGGIIEEVNLGANRVSRIINPDAIVSDVSNDDFTSTLTQRVNLLTYGVTDLTNNLSVGISNTSNAIDIIGNKTNLEKFRLKFDVGNEKVSFIDSRTTTTGIEYDADYSSGYTDRSLVDKAYVDSISVGGTNGLTKIGNNIELGGTISSETFIKGDGGNHNFWLGNDALNENLTFLRINSIQAREQYTFPFPYNNSGLQINKNPGGMQIIVDATPTINMIRSAQGVTISDVLQDSNTDIVTSSIIASNEVTHRAYETTTTDETFTFQNKDEFYINTKDSGVETMKFGLDRANQTTTFTDSRTTTTGIEYGADYSTDFTDRSLVDKAYVDNVDTILQNQIDGFKLYTATATTTITSTGAILTPTTLYNGTAIGSNTIPANTLQVGDTIKTKLRGYLNVTTTGVFAFDVQLGGTSLGSASSVVIAHPKTNTLIELDFEFTVRSIGATGSVIGQGVIHISLGSVATPAMVQLVKTTTTTIDTTTTNLLDYLIDWDAGFTGNVNITNAIIEK